jgi:Na+/H+ antiporter NhaD/arsenite permease-like protein
MEIPVMNPFGNEFIGLILLAFTNTVAGNLTLSGSVASIIVAESVKNHYDLNIVEYLKFGHLAAIAVLFEGVSIIYLMMA